MRECSTPTYTLAHFYSNERIFGEMPVEREEFLAAAGFVPQNHNRSVVQRCGIVCHDVNHAIQRRAERSARPHEKVHAEMDRSPFVRGITARPKQRRSVKQPCFIVTADTYGNVRTLHGVKYFFRECVSFRDAWVGSEKCTANTQIKNKARGRSQIIIQ